MPYGVFTTECCPNTPTFSNVSSKNSKSPDTLITNTLRFLYYNNLSL